MRDLYSELPFAANTFDLVTAVETHFWWPDLQAALREILRVLKPGGTLAIIAEIYKGAETKTAQRAEKYISRSGMKFLSVDEHHGLFADAWLCRRSNHYGFAQRLDLRDREEILNLDGLIAR